MISKSLYVTQYLLSNKEYETRIKWYIGSVLIIFDYEKEQWVKGKIIDIFTKHVYKNSNFINQKMLMRLRFQKPYPPMAPRHDRNDSNWNRIPTPADAEWFCISYGNKIIKKREVQRFSKDIGPIYKNDITNNNNNIIPSISETELTDRIKDIEMSDEDTKDNNKQLYAYCDDTCHNIKKCG
eukprot:454693_1